MATTKQYEQINDCLNHLQFLLKRMGIAEFSISENKRFVSWEVEEEIDQALLDAFCTSIGDQYNKIKS